MKRSEVFLFVLLTTLIGKLYIVFNIWFSRLKGPDPEDLREDDANLRIVISAPDKQMPLERTDIAFMLVQFEDKDGDLVKWEEVRGGHVYTNKLFQHDEKQQQVQDSHASLAYMDEEVDINDETD